MVLCRSTLTRTWERLSFPLLIIAYMAAPIAARAQSAPSATGTYRYWHQALDVTYATTSVCEAKGTLQIWQSGRDLQAQVRGTQHCTGRPGYPDADYLLSTDYVGRINPSDGGFSLRPTNPGCSLTGGLSPRRAVGDGDVDCGTSKGKFTLRDGPGTQNDPVAAGSPKEKPRYTEGLYQDDYQNGAKKGGDVEPPGATYSGVKQPSTSGASQPQTPRNATPNGTGGNGATTPPSGAYGGTPGGVLSAPTSRPTRNYPTQLYLTITGRTPAGRRVRNACADINVAGVTARVLGDVSYYTSSTNSAGTFQIQVTLTRPDMWLPGDYPVNVTAATNCARSGEYLVFDPLNTAVRLEYPSAGGLVGRSFRFEVRTR